MMGSGAQSKAKPDRAPRIAAHSGVQHGTAISLGRLMMATIPQHFANREAAAELLARKLAAYDGKHPENPDGYSLCSTNSFLRKMIPASRIEDPSSSAL